MSPRPPHTLLCTAVALALVGCASPPTPDAATDAPATDGAADTARPDDTSRTDAVVSDDGAPVPPADAGSDASTDGPPADAPAGPPFCTLGTDVPGAVTAPGLCVRRFAAVNEARVLVIAPNGDVIVAAPSEGTPGAAFGGPGAILVLTDDNHDGAAEVHTFAARLPTVHGLALAPGYLYFTQQSGVFRTPYTPGQRAETAGARERVAEPTNFGNGRWTHGLARSAGGTLYTSFAEYSTCGPGQAGKILRLDAGGASTIVASGFRNPMYMRCHYRDEVCLAAELGEDQTPGAREKILLLRPSTWYGYPCCHAPGVPATGTMASACADVTREEAQFPIADTPFGLDWERGRWPAPFANGLFIALHGSFYSSPLFAGASIVFAATDPVTHAPTGRFAPVVTGFNSAGSPLSRPSDVAFAPDGRLFFTDDNGNGVYWVAPTDLRMPAR